MEFTNKIKTQNVVKSEVSEIQGQNARSGQFDLDPNWHSESYEVS